MTKALSAPATAAAGTLVYRPDIDGLRAAALCDAKRDVCPMTLDRHYLYSYGDHLSDYGNGLVAKQFLPLLRR
ncbi:hypothetical protein ISJ10_23260 [Burkholderia pseudomallei]|uniref:hypothetical protein n=1 Tax=Burkholderia pseudomallei TaxID=28450 RepID=UPI00048D3133|nr:hypothetical protein [Burkholderia pseudomallei]WGS43426.1 hypothetical protein LFL97_07845 [Burkholderia sp. JSH-S8]AJX96083.1 putative acyltransferase 3 [Burkholderia pseudomallei PB08298010]AYE27966.1 hypothetical protein CNX72_11840 [Burkholderia pseudomallei]MBF3713339.1 hypothetical protein [Burkholderia pseudomallei]MBF3719447.1 hypothetical protein [Burkholderia pseudomallei]